MARVTLREQAASSSLLPSEGHQLLLLGLSPDGSPGTAQMSQHSSPPCEDNQSPLDSGGPHLRPSKSRTLMLTGSRLGRGASSHVEMVGVSRHQATQRPATVIERGLLAFFSHSHHIEVTYLPGPRKPPKASICTSESRTPWWAALPSLGQTNRKEAGPGAPCSANWSLLTQTLPLGHLPHPCGFCYHTTLRSPPPASSRLPGPDENIQLAPWHFNITAK